MTSTSFRTTLAIGVLSFAGVAIVACDDTESGTGATTGSSGSGTAGSSTAGSTSKGGTAGTTTAGSGGSAGGTAGTGTAGTATAGKAGSAGGTAGTGTAGTSTAGKGGAAGGKAGSAGSSTAGAAGSSTAGAAGSSTAGAAGSGTAGSGTAGAGGAPQCKGVQVGSGVSVGGLPACTQEMFCKYGEAAFGVVVDSLVMKAATADTTMLGTSFMTLDPAKIPTLKANLLSFFINAYGGDPQAYPYLGQSLSTAHAGLGITMDQYNYFLTAVALPALLENGVSMSDASNCFAPPLVAPATVGQIVTAGGTGGAAGAAGASGAAGSN